MCCDGRKEKEIDNLVGISGLERIFVVRDLYGQEVILLSLICRVEQVRRYRIDY